VIMSCESMKISLRYGCSATLERQNFALSSLPENCRHYIPALEDRRNSSTMDPS
jgi:hypothetical protein